MKSHKLLNKRLCALELLIQNDESVKTHVLDKKLADIWKKINTEPAVTFSQNIEYERLLKKYNEPECISHYEKMEHLNMMLMKENSELRDIKRKYNEIKTKYVQKKAKNEQLDTSLKNTLQMVKNLTKENNEHKKKKEKHGDEKEKRLKQKKMLRNATVDFARLKDSVNVINKLLPEITNVMDRVTKYDS